MRQKHSGRKSFRGFKRSSLVRAARFLARLNLFSIPLYAIILTGWQQDSLTEFTADATQFLLSVMGVSFERAGLVFSVPVANGNWGAVINWDCVGWKSLLLVFALVMATDYPIRRKLSGLAMLLPLVYAANLFRIAFLIWFVASYDTTYFALVHGIFWSWGLMMFILLCWAVWMKAGNLNIERRIK